MEKKKSYRGQMSYDKGTLALGAAGISMPYLPKDELDHSRENYKSSQDWLSFGWMGNDPKYYENAAVTSIMPKPEDFVEVPFRLLSATIVGGGSWKATDFTNTKMLKKSTPLLDGKPLYKDHETDLDNWVGLVNGTKWSKSFVADDGTVVPAGIDGILAIDIKTNPKVARGVLLGSVFSNSVTVDFAWEMSHPFENEWDFYNKVGTTGSDGKMIRRIATEIYDYYESSLVWLGADPFAKAITESGELKHIDKSSIYKYSKSKTSLGFSKELIKPEDQDKDITTPSRYIIDFGVSRDLSPLTKRKKTKFNTEEMDKKFVLAFLAAFGGDLGIDKGVENMTAEEAIAHLGKLQYKKDPSPEDVVKLSIADKMLELTKGNEAFTELSTKPELLEGIELIKTEDAVKFKADAAKVITLNTEIETLTKTSAIGEKYLKLKRDEAIRLYKTSVGESEVSEEVVSLFNKAEDAAIEGILKQYTKSATEKFSGSCASCGSHEFKFQSSFQDGSEEGTAEEVTADSVSTDAFRQHFGSPKMDIRVKAETDTK